MVRISGFHPDDPGSNPGRGSTLFLMYNTVAPLAQSVAHRSYVPTAQGSSP